MIRLKTSQLHCVSPLPDYWMVMAFSFLSEKYKTKSTARTPFFVPYNSEKYQKLRIRACKFR
jgi:hypothetical protein